MNTTHLIILVLGSMAGFGIGLYVAISNYPLLNHGLGQATVLAALLGIYLGAILGVVLHEEEE